MHTWRVGGTGGKWVHHSSGGSGTDHFGLELGDEIIGPFQSVKLARKTAEMLNKAYELGQEDKLKQIVDEWGDHSETD